MWLALTTWLTGSKIGRWIAGIGAALVTFGLLLWRAYAAGKAAVKAQQNARALEDLRLRQDIEDELAKQTDAQRRDSLRRWVRDDKRV